VVPVGKTGTLLYAETPSPASQTQISAADSLPFTDLTFAVYLGTETAGSVMMTNARTLPLDGRRAAVAVPASLTGAVGEVHLDGAPGSVQAPGAYLLVVKPTHPLSGTTAGLFPWALLILGLLSTAGVFLLFETALRRRDHALRLVSELEERNAAVQSAMDRQAKAEESLRQAQRMEAVGRLAGGVAHDFNNLLAVILTYAGFLEDSLQDDARAEDVGEIKVAAQRAADLTRQLLVFSRRDVVRPTVLDLVGLLSDAERLLGRTLGEDIEISLIHPGPVLVHADAGELHQVVMNLAVNARDAMPSGGRLELCVDVVGGDARPERVRLRVTDTGVGMSPATCERVFEPFFTTKEVGRGTGLGLATVYGIVDRWGGSITVDSEPGHGTTFTILLPLAEGALPLGPADSAPDDAESGTPRAVQVLLVEDEPSVRRASRRTLESAGYEVIEAADGHAAMEVFGHHRPDIVVTDIVMPGGMSGPELAAVLHEVMPALPVVFVSGYGRDHLLTHGELPEDVILLHKPYPGEDLVAAIRSALDEVMA
jgi:signal transduction histidine kinase